MKPMKAFTLLTIAAGALAFAAPSALAQNNATAPKEKTAQPEKKVEKKVEKHADAKFAVGGAAPDFSLLDTEGKEHKLSSDQGKIVVLTWFNPECPYVVKHFEKNKTFADLYKKYHEKVQFYAINSGAAGEQGSGKERNAKARKDWGIDFPVLLDETGATGKAYTAKNTPFTVVIGADGKVAYAGAPDDDNSQNLGKTNYVAKALDELLAGKPVSTSSTRPYGCAVKYKN